MNDGAILRGLRSKDPASLEKLMDKYIPYVSAIVWNFLRASMTKEDAEEVVSDVFLAAWNQAKDIRPNALKPWLGAVARNKARQKLRSAGFDLPLEEDVLDIPAGDTPEERMTRAEEARLVREAVDYLGQPDREIFLRHYWYAQSLGEIGAQLHLNESTIKTKLRRGRQRLKEILQKWGAV